MDNYNDDDYPLDFEDGTDDGGSDELVDSHSPFRTTIPITTGPKRSLTRIFKSARITIAGLLQSLYLSIYLSPTPLLSDPAALASRMLQLSGVLRRRAQPSGVTTNHSPPLLPVPSSRRSSANQSAESLSSARGISTAPSPSRLQPPPPRGSRNRRKSGTSVARKPKDPDSVPRTIVYPASSELQQRPSAGKETNTNQILRVEVNTIRIEQMLHRMIEESRSSLTSASALCQQELPQAMATERTQMEARLMGSLTDDISIPSFGWALTIQKEYIEDVILRCFRRHSIAIVSIVTAALPIE